jgi:tRNA threonylcarbamoyladenosine biosynthesis protein TsaE
MHHPIVIALSGELGAGKTTLVSGFLRELGVTGSVRSPTYTLVEPYDLGARTVYHLDLYRLADARELEMLAPRDMLTPGAVLLIEWAERAGRALPTPDLSLTLRYPVNGVEGVGRTLNFQSATTTGKELAMSLQSSADESGLSS